MILKCDIDSGPTHDTFLSDVLMSVKHEHQNKVSKWTPTCPLAQFYSFRQLDNFKGKPDF